MKSVLIALVSVSVIPGDIHSRVTFDSRLQQGLVQEVWEVWDPSIDSPIVKRDGSNVPTELRSVLDSIGLLTLPENSNKAIPTCTAFYIGDNKAVAAGHCFIKDLDPKSELTIEVHETPGTECPAASVFWGFRGDSPGRYNLETACERLLLKEVGSKLDVAVFTIRPDPNPKAVPNLPPALGLKLSTGTPAAKVAVLGHKNGMQLRYSQYCDTFPWRVAPWLSDEQRKASTAKFLHRCNTDGGTSGGPVFAASTGEVVGIHNGGTFDSSKGAANAVVYNWATFIGDPAVVERLRAVGVNVAASTGGTP